jgi:uncharacterized membrane protein
MILHVPPDAPLLVRFGADALLALHIGGGTVGLLSGAAALTVRKGGRLHRWAGNLFFVSMVAMATVGATVSPLLHDRVSTVAGIFTLYLLATAWMAVKRRDGGVGRFEIGALVVVLGVVAAGVTFILMQNASPTGMVDGQPPQAPWMFAIVATIAALSDLKVMLRGGISGAPRIARHLWRVCFALFIASGSLFLGQSQVFPAPLRHSGLLAIPALAPLALLIFWLLRVRLAKGFKSVALGRQPSSASA